MDRDPLKHDFEEETSVNLIGGLGPIYLPRMDYCRHCGEHRDAHSSVRIDQEVEPPVPFKVFSRMTQEANGETIRWRYQALPGDTVQEATRDMVLMSDAWGINVECQFNNQTIVAYPGSVAENLAAQFMAESKARYEAYLASPECARRNEEAAAAQKIKDETLKGALAFAPEKLTIAEGQESAWAETVANNSDDYGAAGVRYAETWARLMEGSIANGATVAECAEEASHIADTEGITGFMYGCAVSILSKIWVHGEELRVWHNLKTQIGSEGERANASGGVLNPALITIGEKEEGAPDA